MHERQHEIDCNEKSMQVSLAKIKLLESAKYDLIRQADKQNQIEFKVASISRDLGELKRSTRSIIDHVDELIFQKKASRSMLQNDSGTLKQTTDREINQDLNIKYSKRGLKGKSFIQCKLCKKSILDAIYNSHLDVCSIRQKNSSRAKQSIIHSHNDPKNMDKALFETKVRPTPPRNLRIGAIDHSSFTLQWDDSIFDGGSTILDYEISYSIGSRIESFSCSIFVMVNPLPGGIFLVSDLQAKTSHRDVKVRCRNKIGWSDYSESIDIVTTKDPTNPSPPTHVTIQNATDTSFTITWSPPFCTGGVKLQEYLLFYDEQVKEDESSINIYPPKELEFVNAMVKISPVLNQWVVENLEADSIYKNINLVAINSFDYSSGPSTTHRIQTLKSSNSQILEASRVDKTLEDANSVGPSGISTVQKKELSLSEINLNTSASPCLREKQFRYRISCLEKKIDENRSTIELNMKERAILSRKITTEQVKIHEYTSELKRVTEVEDEYVSSSLLHGCQQKLKTNDFRKNIKRELDSYLAAIEAMRVQILHIDDTNKLRNDEIQKFEVRVSERKAAYAIFIKRKTKSFRLLREIANMQDDILSSCFHGWKRCLMTSIGLQNMVKIRNKHYLWFTSKKMMRYWHDVAIFERNLLRRMNNEHVIQSKAGMLLIQSEVSRQNVAKDIEVAMRSISVKDSLLQADELLYMKETVINALMELLPLLRGDFYSHSGYYSKAIEYYELAMNDLSQSTLGIADVAVGTCSILNKCGCMAMSWKRFNLSLLYFDRLAKISEEFHLKIYVGISFLNMGKLHSEMGNLNVAKEEYFSALVIFQELGRTKLVEETTRRLNACQSSDYLETTSVGELPTENKTRELVRKGIDMAFDLCTRIRNDSLHLAKVVDLKRESCRGVMFKRRKEEIEDQIVCTRNELLQLQQEIVRLPKLLQSIKDELYPILDPVTELRASSLVHGNSQVFTRDDLQDRLTAKYHETREMLDLKQSREESCQLELRNMEHELLLLNQNIEIENGQLVQKIISKQDIRLLVFNSLGEDSDDQQDYSLFIAASISTDLFIYDSLSGSIVNVFEGGIANQDLKLSKSHTGIITALFFEGRFLFSGAKDCTIRCWDIFSNDGPMYTCDGHRSTITDITGLDKFLLSGSADRLSIVWNKSDGSILHKLDSHTKGVLSLSTGDSIFTSGGADGTICIWDSDKFSLNKKIWTKNGNRITAIKCGSLEILCGDSSGCVTSFWLESSKKIFSTIAHEASITCLDLDASRIVSGGMDSCVKVLDATTGVILNTIRDFEKPVICLKFDEKSLVTLSKEGTIKHFYWNVKAREGLNGSIHIVTPGDSIEIICKKYGISKFQFLKWNGTIDLKSGSTVTVSSKQIRLAKSEYQQKKDKNIRLRGNEKCETLFHDDEEMKEHELESSIYFESSALASRLIKRIFGFCPNSQFQPLPRNVSPFRMAEEDSMVTSKFEAEGSSSQEAKNLVRNVDKVQQWKDEEMAANTMGGGGISSIFVVIPLILLLNDFLHFIPADWQLGSLI